MRLTLGIFAVTLFAGISYAYPPGASIEIDGRVVNGTDSSIERYPWMISLRGRTGSHSCGGSIIGPYHILTAAHCIDGKVPSDISIQFGQTVISANGPNVIPVKKIHKHENYQPLNSTANDVAVLELQGRLVFNYITVAPVQLPEQDFETSQAPEGSPGVLTGYGLDKTGGTIQKHLQEVNLKIFPDDQCQRLHENKTYPQMHICGGVDEGGKGQCSGDSGGPLTLNGRVQVGIVSWSIKPCTVYPYPGVYVKVSKYINWIKEKMALYEF